MNKLKEDKNFCPQDCKYQLWRNQPSENSRSSPRQLRSFNMKIAMANAYASLRRVSEEFNIPIVDKTFGSGIVRVSCRTIPQLDNIALITKELVKCHLIAEIGMEPLEYSVKMKSMLLFLKPTDITAGQRLVHMFQKYPLTSFGYEALAINVEHPVTKKGSFKSKRIAVKNAYYSLCQILKEFNIPCLKEIFGPRIIRVCCRSVVQLVKITQIIKQMLELCLIEEIKMPLEYAYKMRSLVIFIKPVDIKSSIKIDYIFKNSSFKYHHSMINIQYHTAAAKENSRKEPNFMTSINLIKPDMIEISMINVSQIFMYVTIIGILLTILYRI